MHPGPALRRRGRQDNSPYQVRPDESDLLGNEAADREPEDIDASDVQPCNEGKRIASHLLDRARSCSSCGTHTHVVERNDAPLPRQRVDEWRVPVLQVPAKVL
jgi:hypothetical protein